MRRLIVTLATAALVATGLTQTAAYADPTVPPTWDHGPGGERYVSFGDSFVSGPGIAPQRAGSCARSEKNFPTLVATRLDATAFTDISCGGATTANYWTAQGDNPPQLDAVSPDTTLVTLGSMGGNDVNLVGLAVSCISSDCAGTVGDARYQAIDALVPTFQRIIEDVRDRAPDALQVAVGYGTYLPRNSCSTLKSLGITAQEANYLQGLIDHLSDTIEQVADEEGIAFADMREIPDAVHHTPCAEPDQQYLRGINTYDDGAPLHPSTLGMRKMATVVAQTIREARMTPGDHLDAAADSLSLRAVCTGKGTHRRVTLAVGGGDGLARKTVFGVGRATVATDWKAPFRTTKHAAPLTRGKAARGKVSAAVTLRYDDQRRTKVVRAARPGCLR